MHHTGRPANGAHGDEPSDEVRPGFAHGHRRLAVRRRRQVASGAHLGQQEQAPADAAAAFAVVEALLQPIDHARPADGVRVGDVGPGRDLVDAAGELLGDRAADVGELAILPDQEPVPLRTVAKLGAQVAREIRHDVDVRLQHADVGAQGVGDRHQLRCGQHVGRQAQVRLLLVHQLEQAPGDRVRRQRHPGRVRQRQDVERGRRRRWDLVGFDEGGNVGDGLAGDDLTVQEDGHDVGDGGNGVEAHAFRFDVRTAALLAVEDDRDVADDQAMVNERFDGLEDAGAGCDQVLDDEASMPGFDLALDGLLRPVRFGSLLPLHDHRDVMLDRQRRRDRQRRVRDAANDIELTAGDRVPDRFRRELQQRRARHEHAQVQVERRRYAALQRVRPVKSERARLVQPDDQRLRRVRYPHRGTPPVAPLRANCGTALKSASHRPLRGAEQLSNGNWVVSAQRRRIAARECKVTVTLVFSEESPTPAPVTLPSSVRWVPQRRVGASRTPPATSRATVCCGEG